MKLITLTQGKFAAVSDEDYNLLTQYKWFATYEADRAWVAATKLAKDAPNTKMHRMIMGVTEVPSLQVDHINGRMLDAHTINNIRDNLRICTNSENNCNRPKTSKKCSSMYKGVCWDYNRQRWIAYINKSGQRKNLGRFENELDAAQAYNDAAIELHQEFASLNVLSPSSGAV